MQLTVLVVDVAVASLLAEIRIHTGIAIIAHHLLLMMLFCLFWCCFVRRCTRNTNEDEIGYHVSVLVCV